MVRVPAFVAEQFQDARRDVGAFGVEHGVVVGEGNLFQDVLGAILVEGRPAAVLALEGQHPLQAALEAFIALLRVVGRDFAQGQQHHGGVVHVRVPFVVELKDPAAGFDVGRVFVIQSPRKRISFAISHSAALFQGRMIARECRIRAGRWRRWPCPRPARSKARCGRCRSVSCSSFFNSCSARTTCG